VRTLTGRLGSERRNLSCAAMRGASGGPDVEAGAAVSADGDIAGGGGGWRWIRQAPPLLFFSLFRFRKGQTRRYRPTDLPLVRCGLVAHSGCFVKGLPSI
jgi:hypothetical protein